MWVNSHTGGNGLTKGLLLFFLKAQLQTNHILTFLILPLCPKDNPKVFVKHEEFLYLFIFLLICVFSLNSELSRIHFPRVSFWHWNPKLWSDLSPTMSALLYVFVFKVVFRSCTSNAANITKTQLDAIYVQWGQTWLNTISERTTNPMEELVLSTHFSDCGGKTDRKLQLN